MNKLIKNKLFTLWINDIEKDLEVIDLLLLASCFWIKNKFNFEYIISIAVEHFIQKLIINWIFI